MQIIKKHSELLGNISLGVAIFLVTFILLQTLISLQKEFMPEHDIFTEINQQKQVFQDLQNISGVATKYVDHPWDTEIENLKYKYKNCPGVYWYLNILDEGRDYLKFTGVLPHHLDNTIYKTKLFPLIEGCEVPNE